MFFLCKGILGLGNTCVYLLSLDLGLAYAKDSSSSPLYIMGHIVETAVATSYVGGSVRFDAGPAASKCWGVVGFWRRWVSLAFVPQRSAWAARLRRL